ncbi:uncharacterized protein LOC113146909 [Cyclospora cayetanensis]|uniref:Uncharacterized protein LOC113146909 n=1 Tax=Cyclospora cayetanensis TaxID=88456 RepID=A0A6P6RUC8_9EIME|nr:uncharacterized protein LOC113146909 [Cyclospora cayetanensis]
MASSSPPTPAKTLRSGSSGRNAFSGRGVIVLGISVVVVQLALLCGLYIQNLQLSGDVAQFKSQAETYQGKQSISCTVCDDHLLLVLNGMLPRCCAVSTCGYVTAALLAQNSDCICPACPSAEEAVRSSLVSLHQKFEESSEKLSKGVETVNKKISMYAKKFESLVGKVQNLMPLAGFNI